jgi:hypothetical protein
MKQRPRNGASALLLFPPATWGRNEPAIADDLEAVIRFTKCAPEEREEALWRDPWTSR